MNSFAQSLSDERLIDIVRSLDRVAKPLAHRMEGDDAPIVELMKELGLSQDIANKLLIGHEVLRECAHRGLQITRSNSVSPKGTDEEVNEFRPGF